MTMADVLILSAILGFAVPIWYFRRAARQDREMGHARRANPAEILDEVFDGEQVVTFTTHRNTLTFETVVKGASERGYELTSQANVDQYGTVRDLVFTRR